jgi:thiosulfate dehydrogenase [quinone] large subunit
MSTLAPGEQVRPRPLQFSESPISRLLFGDVRLAPLWLVLRVYLGYEWFRAGWDKVFDDAWVGANAGAAVTGFTEHALTLQEGAHPDVQGWYGAFLENVVIPNAGFFSYLVAFGEVLVGAALILGVFTGIAAFFGLLMNASYLLAGTVSTNPILLFLGLLILLAWRTAGWWGLDRWLLPLLGTPLRPGPVFTRDKTEEGELVECPC